MIRKTEIRDADGVAQLAAGLWPETGYETLRREFETLLREEDCAVFLFPQFRFNRLIAGFVTTGKIKIFCVRPLD